jgi:hypothetical protein
MSEEYDFHAEIEHLAVFGICSNCKGDAQEAG